MSDRVRIERSELFAAGVDRALERERRLRNPDRVHEAPVSPMRALLLSSLFYLPAAGFLGAVVAWLWLEPRFDDMATVSGQVVLVDSDPVDAPEDAGRYFSLTVDEFEVYVLEGETVLEPGANGEPAISSLDAIESGSYVEVVGEPEPSAPNRILAAGIRPTTRDAILAAGGDNEPPSVIWEFLFFPLIATSICLALLVAEGVASRNWLRMVERALLSSLLTFIFALIGSIPAGLVMALAHQALPQNETFTVATIPPVGLFFFAAGRSAAWACIGACLGVGMNLARSTKLQLRNSVVGGALGAAIGGIFFDPIGRLLSSGSMFEDASASRLVGMIAVGVGIGFFVALVDRLARQAWLRVRTGPLAGKSFVLYKTPTLIGSTPRSDIYLFKDAEIDPSHASIHKIGNRYEIEDMNSRTGVRIGARRIHRRALSPGDQIVIGSTVLEFEERTKRTHG